MIYKYLQVEDNPKAAETVDLLMKEYDDFLSTTTTYDLKESIKAILTHKPDLIFLDVELPGFTGFEFIKTLRNHLQELPTIIMTTAHEKYALPAVNEEILYYLLKPLDPDDLLVAINKFRNKKTKEKRTITIKNQKGYFFLDYDNIFLIQASSNYTYFYTRQLEKVLVSKTMKDFEARLGEQFLRIHKGYIINLNYVKFFNTTKKKIQLSVPELVTLNKNDDFLLPLLDLLIEGNLLEISIGEAHLEKVKNSILYHKIG